MPSRKALHKPKRSYPQILSRKIHYTNRFPVTSHPDSRPMGQRPLCTSFLSPLPFDHRATGDNWLKKSLGASNHLGISIFQRLISI